MTYRRYDYGRTGIDGKPRNLDIEKPLSVTRLDTIEKAKSFSPHLVQCGYFVVDKIFLDGNYSIKGKLEALLTRV